MSEADIMAAMGISGFGKTKKTKNLDPTRFDKNKRDPVTAPAQHVEEKDDDDDDRPEAGPSRPVQQSRPQPDGDFAEPEYDPSDNEAEDDVPEFPISHEMVLKDHTKVISALTLDPSGARILTGSHDYECKLWDFGGMDQRLKPFRSWEPAGAYHINDVKYSNDGQKFLVISGTTQAKLYDRDGEEEATFVKGDMYIRDMKNTSGHVSEIFSCAWHPKDSKVFITGSADSTIRIWNVENKRKQKDVIVVKSKDRGARTKITSCAYSPDGSMIGAACLDGAVHLWNTKSNFVRPNHTIEGAHTKNTDTGSIAFSVDGNMVVTRGGPGDETVKLWDVRAFRKPLFVKSGLETPYPRTNAIFSPDGKYIVTGSGATVKGGSGQLLILGKNEGEIVQSISVPTTPVKVQWHSKINQIVTGLSNGQIVVLYSPSSSLNGAKLILNKGPPRKVTAEDVSGAAVAPVILTPGADDKIKDTEGLLLLGNKRKRYEGKVDPRKLRRPELPVTGPGRGGRVGASATQHVVQNLVRDTSRDEDPREALLKYAEISTEDPLWTAAWTRTQPKPVFADETEEKKEDEES